MHPNRAFAWTDRGEMLDFLADVAFATVFVPGPDGGFVLHAPVVVQDADHIRFHIARTNRAAAAMDGAPAILSCLGPDAYISPDWYGTPDQVPTWNYLAVECEGRLRRMDEAELVAQLDALSAAHEARLAPKPPWTRAKMGAGRFEAMVRAIVGYELAVEAIRGTRKLGQHKKLAEREGAVAGLAAAGRPDMAELMRTASLAKAGAAS
jgi:transcriptional regulator